MISDSSGDRLNRKYLDDFKNSVGENIYTTYIPFVMTDLYLLKYSNVKLQDPLVLNK